MMLRFLAPAAVLLVACTPKSGGTVSADTTASIAVESGRDASIGIAPPSAPLAPSAPPSGPKALPVPGAVSVAVDGALVLVRDDTQVRAFDASGKVVHTLRLPAPVFDDHGDVLLLGPVSALQVCRVSTATCTAVPHPPMRADTDDTSARISPSGKLVALGRQGRVLPNAQVELKLYVHDTTSSANGTWRSVAGPSFPVAGGTFELCAIDDATASWCYSRGHDRVLQDAVTGKTDRPPTPPRRWSAVRNVYWDRGYGQNGIEIVGPAPSRWVEVAPEPAFVPEAITCGDSNHALVVRPASLELRELPSWRLVTAWNGEVTKAACSTDAKRIAWLAKSGAKTELRVIER